MKSNTPHIGYNTVNSLNIVYLRHCIQSTWLLYISSTLNLILLYSRHCHTVNLVIIYIFDTRYSQYHRHCIQSTWLLYIFSTLQVSIRLAPWYDVSYDFRVKRCSVRLYCHLLCMGFMNCLHFRSNRVHIRFLVGIVLLDFSFMCIF